MKKYLLLFILTLPLYSSLLRPGFYNSQDSMQPFRIYQMSRCLLDLQIPCRWVPDLGYGYGYPLFIFYAPGPYYLGALISFLDFSFVDSTKLLLVGGFLVSGLGMFVLLRQWLSSPLAALVGSAIYLYAPIRAVQVYVRGSLSEFLSFAVFPFLFLFSYRLIHFGRWRDCGLFAVSLAAIFLTHNLMSMAIFGVLLFWIIYHLILVRRRSVVLKTLLGLVLGIGLTAFFLIPLLAERNLVHLDSMLGGYFGYRQHFVNIGRLFLSNSWGYGSSAVSPASDLALSVGPLHWGLSLIALVLSFFHLKRNSRLALSVIGLSLLEIFVLFLIHSRSTFIWEAIPFLAYFQFPWRFLVISNFLAALLSASVFVYLQGTRWSRPLAVTVLVLLLLLHGRFFQPQRWTDYTDSQMFTPTEYTRLQTISIFDYLPKSAVLPPQTPAPELPEIISGSGSVLSYRKSSLSQSGQIVITSVQAKVRLPLYDYLGMQVRVNGQPVAFDHADCRNQPYCYGLINFNLPRGTHQIQAEFTSTSARKLADWISLLSVAILSVMLLSPLKKTS